jgi:4,4'-diaponeurosporenoate glycosyltransferase
VAFGPVLACTRASYLAVGGHAAPDVRNTVLEDIALARRFDRRQLYVGSADGTSFRMYPAGLRSLVEGWTKGIAIGACAAPGWATLGTAAWVTSVAGGWLVSPWFALATLLQLAVVARRAGRFAPWMIVLYPVATALFVIVMVRSLGVRRAGGQVSWRGRRLRPDQQTG